MGRPRKPLDATADAKAVRARLKDKDLEGWQRQRLQAAQLGLAAVFSLPQIAEEVGVSPRTIGSWFAAFRDGGIAGLLARKPKGGGPASWLDPQTAREFKAELDKGRWRRAQDARCWLEKKLGRKLTLIVTYKYLGKCEARLKVPRPTHRKKDPARVEAFRAELCEKLHGEQIALEQSVHLWVSDEMRFGLQPVTRRVWARRGVEVVLPVEPRYEWGYTYGALEVCGDGAEFAVASAPPCGLPFGRLSRSARLCTPTGSAWKRAVAFWSKSDGVRPRRCTSSLRTEPASTTAKDLRNCPPMCGSSTCRPTARNSIPSKDSGTSSRIASATVCGRTWKNSWQRSTRCWLNIGALRKKSALSLATAGCSIAQTLRIRTF